MSRRWMFPSQRAFCRFGGVERPTHRLKTAGLQQEPRPRTSSCLAARPKVQSRTQTSPHVLLEMNALRSLSQREKKRLYALLRTSWTRPTQFPLKSEAQSTTGSLYSFFLPRHGNTPLKWCVSKVYLLSASLTLGTACPRVTGF